MLVKIAIFASACALSGCGGPAVVRVVDGRAEEGRFISQGAYAYYGRAATAEAAGDLASATRWLEAASALDPEGPEVWTKLGSVRCRATPMSAPAPAESLADFDRAEALDATFAPQHRERARCLLAHGDAQRALASADRALALDPDDPAISILRAHALERAGKPEDARLALRALTTLRPRSADAWLALLDLGKRTGHTATVREAAEHAAALSPELAGRLARDGITGGPLAAIDEALGARDLTTAQKLAHKARIPWAELSVRAAALGRSALAREQAELVLGADPSSTSARIALVAAADLQGDTAAISAAMRGIPARGAAPSPLARLLFAEVLARRTGREAALAWLGPAWAAARHAAGDRLLSDAAARLEARLSPSPSR